MQLHASLYSEGYKVSTSHDPIAEVMFCLKYCIHIVGGLPPHGYTNTWIHANVQIHRVTHGLITQNVNTWIRFTYMLTIANMLNCTYTLHALHCPVSL